MRDKEISYKKYEPINILCKIKSKTVHFKCFNIWNNVKVFKEEYKNKSVLVNTDPMCLNWG